MTCLHLQPENERNSRQNLGVNTMICKYTQCLVFVPYISLFEKCISKQDN